MDKERLGLAQGLRVEATFCTALSLLPFPSGLRNLLDGTPASPSHMDHQVWAHAATRLSALGLVVWVCPGLCLLNCCCSKMKRRT